MAIVEGLYLEQLTQKMLDQEPALDAPFDEEGLLSKVKQTIAQINATSLRETHKKTTKQGNQVIWFSLAAVLVLLLAVWGLLRNATEQNHAAQDKSLLTQDSLSKPQPQPKKQDSTQTTPQNIDTPQPQPTPDNTLAFAENPELELLLASTVMGDSVYEVQPQKGTVAKGEILFQWKTDEQRDFYIEILDNQKRKVHQATIQKGQMSYALKPDTLSAGLYYWKLLDAEELLHTGKFIVKAP
jgi:hypothetical protein